MSSHHSSRYDASGDTSENHYVDADETILENLPGITSLDTLLRKEEEGLATAYELLLDEVRVDTPLTCELIRHIHHRIFGELYSWAGRWRTVWIQKPGVTWPPPDHLEQAMEQFEREVLSRHPASALIDDQQFCRVVGHIQGEFLAIHPLREGNARTIKLLTDLLAVQTGRPPLRYDRSDKGRNEYIEAAKAAMLVMYEPMTAVITLALKNARQAA